MAHTASADNTARIPVDLDLDNEQQQLQEAIRGFLSRHYPLGDVRAILESERELDPKRWREAAEMGWIAALVPEVHGGLGFNPAAASIIASELGRAANWMPFLGCALSAAALATTANLSSEAAALLKSLTAGETTAAWCGPEPRGGEWGSESIRSQAVKCDEGWILDGDKRLVADADLAEWLVVSAWVDGSLTDFVIPVSDAGVEITVSDTLDLTRRFATVKLSGVKVTADRLVGKPGDGKESYIDTLDLATTLVAADATGAAEKLMEMTVDYAQDRIAFQRPIASYQAVKHMCANMLLRVEASRAASRYAAMSLDSSSDERVRAIPVAGAYVSDATAAVAGDALQIHGGVGFTWEHDLHLFLRRIKVDQALFGDSRWHRERISRQLT